MALYWLKREAGNSSRVSYDQIISVASTHNHCRCGAFDSHCFDRQSTNEVWLSLEAQFCLMVFNALILNFKGATYGAKTLRTF